MKTCANCPNVLGRRNVSGLCKSCSGRVNARNMHRPEVSAKRIAGVRAYLSVPENRLRCVAHLTARHASISDEERQQRSEWGRHLCREYLAKPEVIAKARSPENRAIAGQKVTASRLAWCPQERWDDYRALLRMRIPAAEARAMIESEIPGTLAHARRTIANNNDASRIREERRKAQAY